MDFKADIKIDFEKAKKWAENNKGPLAVGFAAMLAGFFLFMFVWPSTPPAPVVMAAPAASAGDNSQGQDNGQDPNQDDGGMDGGDDGGMGGGGGMPYMGLPVAPVVSPVVPAPATNPLQQFETYEATHQSITPVSRLHGGNIVSTAPNPFEGLVDKNSTPPARTHGGNTGSTAPNPFEGLVNETVVIPKVTPIVITGLLPQTSDIKSSGSSMKRNRG